jgi:hypothetical protein
VTGLMNATQCEFLERERSELMTAQTLNWKTAVDEVRQDPSLMLALGTGAILTAFLATVHACCLGLATPPMAALLQICSSAG